MAFQRQSRKISRGPRPAYRSVEATEFKNVGL